MPRRTRTRTKPAAPAEVEGFRPFADDAAVRTLGALSFENGSTRIAVYGSLDLTRDRPGMDRARVLKATVDAIVAALEGQDLPEQVAEETEAARTVRNPFA